MAGKTKETNTKEVNTKEDKDITVGELLKKHREEQKLNIADVVFNIKIKYSHIEAIESNSFNKLPGITYALGYIKSYAKFLKVDPNLVLKKLEQEYDFVDTEYTNIIQNQRLDKKYNPIQVIKENIIDFFCMLFLIKSSRKLNQQDKKMNKSTFYFIVGVIILIVIVLVGGRFFYYNKTEVHVQENPTTINNSLAKKLNLSPEKGVTISKKVDKSINSKNTKLADKDIGVKNDKVATNKDSTSSTSNSVHKITTVSFPKSSLPSVITLKFTSPVWLQIYNSKNPKEIYVDAIYQSGEKFNVPNLPNLSMDIGNYHGVQIVVNKKSINLTSSNNSNVIKDIVLNADNLLKLYGSQ